MTMQLDNTLWLMRPFPNASARLRLLCFPYGGGGASAYVSWAKQLLPGVELCAVQPPGRENRCAEPLLTGMAEMVEALKAIIPLLLDKPFAFFGHSNGALICFELTRYLRRHHLPSPRQLFVSGSSAPHLIAGQPPIYHLPETEFLEKVAELDGMPQLFFDDLELRDLFLPVLRADYTIHDTYTFQAEPPLVCPIVAFGGTEDPLVKVEGLLAWKGHTAADFKHHLLLGDHFFIRSAQALLLSYLNNYLSELIPFI